MLHVFFSSAIKILQVKYDFGQESPYPELYFSSYYWFYTLTKLYPKFAEQIG